ncbi:MAG: SET domain-containing protein-lysine N-methyltransferase [Verrucomicrobiota bacterium]
MPSSKKKKKKPELAEEIHGLWEIRNSKIHGSGIFATQKIKKGTRIIEYIGEKISKKESEKRSVRQIHRSEKTGDGAVYIFEINDDYDIDGNVDWNPARLINHSCEPNCETLNENDRIWIESTRRIKKGEELCYNYGYDLECYEDHPCLCGTKNCVGYIVRKSQWKKLKKLLKKRGPLASS